MQLYIKFGFLSLCHTKSKFASMFVVGLETTLFEEEKWSTKPIL
jgi:hypothetical protein